MCIRDRASALLMPLPQIKKCFYRLKIGRTDEQLIAEMANIFEAVSYTHLDVYKRQILHICAQSASPAARRPGNMTAAFRTITL